LKYQISWGTGNTLIMPEQKDVINEHLKRYLMASSSEHSDMVKEILDPTNGALAVSLGELNEDEKEDFTNLLGDIVSNILRDEKLSIEFLKKDSEAWEQYLGGQKTAGNTEVRNILSEYAEATTLYEIHVGSMDYDRLRGRSGFKFGRDMQKLPKFNIDEFKRVYNLRPIAIPQPLSLEITLTKRGATTTRGTFEEAFSLAQKERKKQRKTLLEQYRNLSEEKLIDGINETLGVAGELTPKRLALMKERFKKGKLKTPFKRQLINILLDSKTSLSSNEITRTLVENNIGMTFRLKSTEPTLMVLGKGKSRGYKQALTDLSQYLLDEKSRQIRQRGVVSGGWTSVGDQSLNFSDRLFEEDTYSEEEDFKGELYLEAETVNGNYKNITQFTFEDMVPDSFLKGKEETKTISYQLNTGELLNQLISDGRHASKLDFEMSDITKVNVNLVEIKFSLPSKTDTMKGVSGKDGSFDKEQKILKNRLKNISVKVDLKTAPIAAWTSNTYSQDSVKPSPKMEEHLMLFRERLEDLIDYYDIEVKGEVDDMEED
jgi:hypothetical protein